jgi:hypothetical protein
MKIATVFVAAVLVATPIALRIHIRRQQLVFEFCMITQILGRMETGVKCWMPPAYRRDAAWGVCHCENQGPASFSRNLWISIWTWISIWISISSRLFGSVITDSHEQSLILLPVRARRLGADQPAGCARRGSFSLIVFKVCSIEQNAAM